MRPSQFAELLLASGESLPRARARDQQADLAGSQLKQRILRRIVELDSPPEEFLATLDLLIVEFGDPTGPTRAMARLIAEEWMTAIEHPQFFHWLLDQAVHSDRDGRR